MSSFVLSYSSLVSVQDAKLKASYQIKDGNLHHTLVEIGSAVFDDLDCDHLLCLEILTLDNLAESALAQDVQDKITIPVIMVRDKHIRELYTAYLWPASSDPRISLT